MRGRGYAKDIRGVDIGDVSYQQLNTYEHDKMSGHKKSPPVMMGIMLLFIQIG
jgi:hypothetical protein